MRMEIKTRSRGLITFSRSGREYVFVDFTGGDNPGTLGQQICDMRGNTLTYPGDDQEGFEKICRRWWAAFRRD